MYRFEKEALARNVAPRVKTASPGKVFSIVCVAVRETGVTHGPDVTPLAKEICSILGKHGAAATAARKARWVA